MKVILKEDVINLGFKDDVVTVKDGYGRNFLIPRGMAVVASESAMKMHNENLRQRAHKLEAIKKEAEAKAEKLSTAKILLMVKTSSQGTIYGSVSSAHLAEQLQAQGHEVERKRIQVPGNIKEPGEYVAKILLHRDVTVELPFTVKSENAPEKKEEPKKEPKAEKPEEAPETKENENTEDATTEA